MTRERFKMLLDAYGGDPLRWPDAERAAALKFVESDAEARRMIEQERAFDRALDLADTAPVTPELQRKILAAFSQRKFGARSLAWFTAWMPTAPQWIPAAAFAASLLLGVGVGALIPSLAGLDAPRGEAALLALGDIDDALGEEVGGGS